VGQAIAGHRPGDVVRLDVVRGKKRRTVTVKLGVRPSKPSTQ
jgi:S1-C subfamily serine protease